MIDRILSVLGLTRKENVVELTEDRNRLLDSVILQNEIIELYKEQVEDQSELIETHRELAEKQTKELQSLKRLIKSKDEANSNLIRETQRQEQYISQLERELLSFIPEEKILSEIKKLAHSIYVNSGTRISYKGMGRHGYIDEYDNVSVEFGTYTNPVEPIVISVKLDPSNLMRLYSDSERQYYWQQTFSYFTREIYDKLTNLVTNKH